MKWNSLLYGLLFSGLGAFSYLLLVNYTDFTPQVARILYSKGALVYFIAVFNVLGYFTLWLSSWMNNQYTRNIRHKWRRAILHVVVMLMFLLLNYGLLVAAKLIAGVSAPFAFPSGGWRILMVVWLVELVILGLLLANRSMKDALRLQQKAAKLQKENNTARYAALQSQLNPHFLFNSLNTLIAEIEYNPDNAVRFTKHLSGVYRYVLQSQDKSLVTLGEELEFMRSYLFLHEVRLGNCISCDCRITPEHTDCLLPPLTLQLLVENVIKHNSITIANPMKIGITIQDDYLIVSNPVQPRMSHEAPGIGLQNLSNRCRLMSGKEIVVENRENIFTVKVPLSYE